MRFGLALVVPLALCARAAFAGDAAPPPAAEAPAKPPPYSLPWQLRPATVPNVVRWDNTVAFYEDAAAHKGTTWVSIFNAIVRIPGTGGPGNGLGVLFRLPLSVDSPPTGSGGAMLGNPLLGVLYGAPLPKPFKLSASIGFTTPVGMGGGDTPSPGTKDARVAAVPARFQIDNALFNVNDLGIVGGADFAYVDHGFTAQVEATLAQYFRVRGELDQPEATKTSFVAGLHLGYFIVPQLSIGADLRYQRWIDAPFKVEKDASGDSWDNLSTTIGLRAHIPIGKTWLRPGVAYARALDKPLAAATPNYHMIQIDIPFAF
ncbi:MAG TPA: hypothetical protein VLM85_16450 [Polyangiaceae bacterium]|nr:hypothetical protein [Polyangiaceae bacterium]